MLCLAAQYGAIVDFFFFPLGRFAQEAVAAGGPMPARTAVVVYADAASAVMATDNMQGCVVADRTLSCTHCPMRW